MFTPTRTVSRAGQISLGLLWLLDGILQFQPYMFGKSLVTSVILPNASGQPGVIAAPITWMASVIAPHVVLFNAFAATLQVLIGLALLYRPTVKVALLVSFVWAISIWFAGEGLGLLLTGTATPLTGAPGAALVYVLAGLMCWPVTRAAADSRPADRSGLGLLSERAARSIWAGIWLGCAALWLLPANNGPDAVHNAVANAPSGADWLSGILRSSAAATAGNGTTIAVTMAALSTAIAISAICNWHAKVFLTLAITISIGFWIVGQGLGGVFTGQATDVGTAPLLILIALLLSSRASGTTRELAVTSSERRGSPHDVAAFARAA